MILLLLIINKYFEFQNNWLKKFLLRTIAHNFVLYHYVKKIKNFEKHWNFSSDIHQNLISTKLHQGATEYEI